MIGLLLVGFYTPHLGPISDVGPVVSSLLGGGRTGSGDGPSLATQYSAVEPQGWFRYANPPWLAHGAPVIFLYGSLACPYCTASSWAIWVAVQQFGPLTGSSFVVSSPDDVYPSTPGVDLSAAIVSSPNVSLAVYEGTNPDLITTPSLPPGDPTNYVRTYDPTGTIPFVVIGGTFVHAGMSLLSPTSLENQSSGSAYTPQQVEGQIASHSGPVWDALAPSVWMIEAILVYLNDGHGPTTVTSNPNVETLLAQIH